MSENEASKLPRAYRVQLALVVEVQTAECDGDVVDVDDGEIALNADVITDAVNSARTCEAWTRALAEMSIAAGRINASCGDSTRVMFTPFVGLKELEEI